MRILVNENELEFTLETEQTVGEILEALEREAESNNATLVGISVNGTLLPAEELDQAFKTPLDTVEEIAVTTVSEDDVRTSFGQMAEQTALLATRFSDLPVLLQTGKDGAVAEILKSFADIFDGMCRLATVCALFPDTFGAISIGGRSYVEFLSEFSPLLKEFEASLKTDDTVLTGDMALYELAPRLEQYTETIRKFI